MKVTQVSQTIQGEGYHLGVPCILIRLAGCNLSCNFCDTKWSLIGGEEKDPKEFAQEIYDLYYKDKSYAPMLMFTGGEPLLQIDDIYIFVEHLYNISEKENLVLDINIESNGVLLKDIDICNQIDCMDDFGWVHVTISPKLNKDFYSEDVDIIELFEDIDLNCKTQGVNNIYKFVHIKEDEEKILEFTTKLDLHKPECYCMAFTPIKSSDYEKQIKNNCLECLDFCMKHGFRYSPREHLYLFGLGKKEWDNATTD